MVRYKMTALVLLAASLPVRADLDLGSLLSSQAGDNPLAEVQRAEQGDADAQFRLGSNYDLGKGVEQDYQEAARWYGLAADQGHGDAQVNLGLMYTEGQGVERNQQTAVDWFRRWWTRRAAGVGGSSKSWPDRVATPPGMPGRPRPSTGGWDSDRSRGRRIEPVISG